MIQLPKNITKSIYSVGNNVVRRCYGVEEIVLNNEDATSIVSREPFVVEQDGRRILFTSKTDAANPAIDLSFYIFVFNAIKAIGGSSEATERARKALQECRKLGGNNRIGIREWYGDAPQGIVSNYKRKNHPSDFTLFEVEGYVKDYQHPGNAVILLDCGLEVFFKPSVKGITQSSQNHRVRFLLGFSYDGLRSDSETVEVIG